MKLFNTRQPTVDYLDAEAEAEVLALKFELVNMPELAAVVRLLGEILNKEVQREQARRSSSI